MEIIEPPTSTNSVFQHWSEHTATSYFWQIPKAEHFAAPLRRLDTQNKVGVSGPVSVKVRKIKAETSFVEEKVAMCRFLQAVDWTSLFRGVRKMDMTVDFVTDSSDWMMDLGAYIPGSSRACIIIIVSRDSAWLIMAPFLYEFCHAYMLKHMMPRWPCVLLQDPQAQQQVQEEDTIILYKNIWKDELHARI